MTRNRMILLAGLGGAVVLMLLYALFLYPQQKRKSLKFQKEMRRVERLHKDAQDRLARTKKALTDLLADGPLIYLQKDQTWSERMPELIRGIDEWLRRFDLELVRMEPQASEERPPLIIHPFLLEFKGSFPDICRFMNGLEGELRLVAQSWSMESESKGTGALQVSSHVVAYEWQGKILDLSARPVGGAKPLQIAFSRDPFQRARESTVTPEPRRLTVDLTLTGILDFPGKRKAIINGKAYKVGDRVEGRRILSIEKGAVVLEGTSGPLKIQPTMRTGSPSFGQGKRPARKE